MGEQLLLKGVRPLKQLRLDLRPRKVAGYIGDRDWLSFDGGPVYRNDDGSYSLEYVHAPEDERGNEPENGRWQIHRVSLDREVPSWIKVHDLASYTGQTPDEVRAAFLSLNPIHRAMAYQDAASYYGWDNFDAYPLELSKGEVNRRYRHTIEALHPSQKTQQRRELRKIVRSWR